MLGESRLNVYVLASDLSPRQRERIQAQVQTGLRLLPAWVFDLLGQRIDALGLANLPLLIEPQPASSSAHKVLSLGRIESRPAIKLTPRVAGRQIDWGQDLPHLLAKAVAYAVAPDESNDFWRIWRAAVRDDRLREKASLLAGEYEDETDLGLLLEMFAAYALRPAHQRWAELTAVRAFLERWRAAGG